jgi:hypothetical protein
MNLTATTSGFVLAAVITVLFNAALSCAKDAYAPLKAVMKLLAGHDWTTQGLVDLILFFGIRARLYENRMGWKNRAAASDFPCGRSGRRRERRTRRLVRAVLISSL